MSQIIKNLASGPVPPAVATSYQTQNGTAVPIANVLIVDGFDSIENNNNGIITKGGVVGTGTQNEIDVVLTNRISVSTTTSDGAGQTQTVTLMTPTNGTAIEFSASFIGYDSINNESGGGMQEGICRKSGGNAVIVGTNDALDEADPALASIDWDIISTGADLSANFVGIAGRTIVWRCTFNFVQTP